MIPNERAHLSIAAISHPGMSGKNNEDKYAVSTHQLSRRNHTPSVLAVLADGVGGHHAGEVAAEIGTKTIRKIVSESDGAKPLQILENAIVQAGQEVKHQAADNQHQQGMGSTCACAWVIGDRLYTASVGDSRIYLIRNHSIQQLTTDHTWVQEAIEHGIIKPEEAKDHPQAHVIRRYLGSQSTVVPDFRMRLGAEESEKEAIGNQGLKLRPGEMVLLCSDGLTDLVNEIEILKVLQAHPNQNAVNVLVELANARGGHDNITIIIMEMPESSRRTKKLETGKKKGIKERIRWYTILILSILIILIAAISVQLVRNSFFQPTSTPALSITSENPGLAPITPQGSMIPSGVITPSPIPSETPIQNTYTPWPTHTYPPEP